MHTEINDDLTALRYVQKNKDCYIAILHSVTPTDKDVIVENILNEYGSVRYKTYKSLSFNGYVNLKKISYGWFGTRNRWIGNTTNNFAGAQDHARLTSGQNDLRIFVFECKSFEKVLQAKRDIRALYNLENYSLHINDVREEALCLAQTFFNKNSLLVLNERPFEFEDEHFDMLLDKLKAYIKSTNHSIENFCMTETASLNVLGQGKVLFICFFSIDDNFQYESLDSTLFSYMPTFKSLAYRRSMIKIPDNHFYYKGLKFANINKIR